jgi:hypothetical protein
LIVKKLKADKADKKNALAKRLGVRAAGAAAGAALIVAGVVYNIHPGGSAHDPAPEGGVYVRRETKPTLSAALFVGKVHTAYQVAHDTPELLDHLYCYCECDKHMGHRSLLSCYTDTHAANCNVCVNEALDGAKMMNDGMEMKDIRREIDRKYSRS